MLILNTKIVVVVSYALYATPLQATSIINAVTAIGSVFTAIGSAVLLLVQ